MLSDYPQSVWEAFGETNLQCVFERMCLKEKHGHNFRRSGKYKAKDYYLSRQ